MSLPRNSRTEWRTVAYFAFLMMVFFPQDPKPFLLEIAITTACYATAWTANYLMIRRDRANQDKTMREIIAFLRPRAFPDGHEVYDLCQKAAQVMNGVPVQQRDPKLSDHMDMQLRLAASEYDTDPDYKKEWSPRNG